MFYLTQFLICKRSLPTTIFLIGLNLSVVFPIVDWQVILLVVPDICRYCTRFTSIFYVLFNVLLYNLVNETNLVHYFSYCISSILFLTSTCFGPLQVHHQEERLYLSDTWYLLFCTADCLVCMPDSQLYRLTSRG